MNIIVTGASSGIGYHLALKLSQNIENKVFAIARTKEKLMSLYEHANSLNSNAVLIPVVYDVDRSNLEELELLVKAFKEFDILVNNAGLMIKKPFLALTDADWLKLYRVNVLGPAKLVRFFAPFMGQNRPAHVVNISSMGGFQGSVKFEGLTAYSASKAALVNLTETLSVELNELDIRVNCLALGAVETPMLAQTFPGYEAPVSSGQMADFIANFCLTGHYYFNGKVLPVSLSTP